MKRYDTPPPLAAWFLERLRPHGDGDILAGDFEEEFHYLRTRHSARYARWWYRGQVVWSLPGFMTQRIIWSGIMLRNYLNIAGRNLLRNGHYTAINLVGLAIALACCIVAYLNHDFNYSFDAFHENGDRIYRVNSIRVVNGQEQRWGLTPMPLGPAMASELAAVEQAVRLSRNNGVFQYGDKVFNETVFFADEAFFDLFTFPMKQGSANALRDPTQVILSEALATRYFGEDDPLGRPITLRFNEIVRTFTVGAVAQPIPKNSSIQFDVLTRYDNLRAVAGDDLDDWGRWGFVTFIQVSDRDQLAALRQQLQPYLALQNAARPDWPIERFYFDPLPQNFLTSYDLYGYILTESLHPAAVVSPAVLAVLLLLMACFNFMNTAIAFAGKRLKEIGIRKVIGGRRHQLIGQFMGESMLLCTLAFGLALLLATIFAPAYSSLWPNIDLEANYSENMPLLAFLVVLLLVTGLMAGAYPALYISRFNPVSILKGRHRLGGMNALTRTLLTAQLSIAVLLFVSGIVFTQNARFQETVDLGYDRERVLTVPLAGQPERFGPYRDVLSQNPDLLRIAGSRNHIGLSALGRLVKVDATDQREALTQDVTVYEVGENYLETMGLRVAAGRAFDAHREADVIAAVMVNETFARTVGWARPVGQMVEMDSLRYEVVGVLEDFYDGGVWNPVDPTLLKLAPPASYAYLTVRVRPDDLDAANNFLRETWRRLSPDDPYGGRYQEEVMAEASLINRSIKTVFYYLSGIAVVIAAAGLFALVSLTIARRTKEIALRKVLGASVLSIGHLINREFLVMLLLASGIASAAGYYTLDLMLDSIWAYHVDLGVLPFLGATLAIFLMAALTVGGRVYTTATANPIHALRYE